MQEKILKMIDLQINLNNITNGPKWTEGVTREGRDIDWLRCIRQEASELIDSYPWKHWRSINNKVDRDNVLIEATDIWHFIISYLLTHGLSKDEIALMYVNGECLEHGDFTIEEEISHIEILIDDTFTNASYVIFDAYLNMVRAMGLSIDDIYKTYIGKNVLNIFRQDNGYLNGTYSKEWDGEEDNVYLVSILESMDDVTYDKIYDELNKLYIKLTK